MKTRRMGNKRKELDADILDFDIVRRGKKVKKVFKAPKYDFDIGV